MRAYPTITEDTIQVIQNIRMAHSLYLKRVKDVFKSVYEKNKSIFRRAPDNPRIKTLESILGHITTDNQNEIIEFVRKMPDIAGARMTITTKDEFEIAKKILQNELKGYGEFDDSRKNNGKMNDRGYSGHHYHLHSEEELNSIKYKVTLEIQIRTLAQDTWAVFEHPERYKSDPMQDQEILGTELLNYAKLMDVADEIAQLIKNRKKIVAEIYCKDKRISNKVSLHGKEPLRIDSLNAQLVSVFYNGQSKFVMSTSDLCDILILLCNNNIHTVEDFSELIIPENKSQILSELRKEGIPDDRFRHIEIIDMLSLFLIYRENYIEMENVDISDKNSHHKEKKIQAISQEFEKRMGYKIQQIKEDIAMKELLEDWEVNDMDKQ